MVSSSLRHSLTHLFAESFTNVTLRISRPVKRSENTETVSTVLYDSGFLALPSLLHSLTPLAFWKPRILGMKWLDSKDASVIVWTSLYVCWGAKWESNEPYSSSLFLLNTKEQVDDFKRSRICYHNICLKDIQICTHTMNYHASS